MIIAGNESETTGKKWNHISDRCALKLDMSLSACQGKKNVGKGTIAVYSIYGVQERKGWCYVACVAHTEQLYKAQTM